MKITGSKNYVKFDLEKSYAVKAEEELSPKQIEEIINEVQKNINGDTVQLIFE